MKYSYRIYFNILKDQHIVSENENSKKSNSLLLVHWEQNLLFSGKEDEDHFESRDFIWDKIFT